MCSFEVLSTKSFYIPAGKTMMHVDIQPKKFPFFENNNNNKRNNTKCAKKKKYLKVWVKNN